jgi:hypothetical protein
LDSKFKDSNIFKPNLNLDQTKINLNKLFKDFSNLELLKISLNMQIETKAINGRLLKMIWKKISKIQFKSFQKVKFT